MDKFIDDFGAKIGGAKKDSWKERGLSINDLDDIDLKEYLKYITKDNIWPTPNYEGYLEVGMEPVCIYLLKTVRDKLQAKTDVYSDGKDRDRAANYIQFMLDVKDTCEQITKEEQIKEFRNILLVGHGYRDKDGDWTNKAKNLPGLDNHFLRFIQFSSSFIKEISYETKIQEFPEFFRGDLKGVTVRQSYIGNGYYIVKGNKVLNRKSFDTVDMAIEYAKTTLIESLDGKKATTKKESKIINIVRPQLEYISRTGPDLRKGTDCSTDNILRAFKFRGGEFGNWNTQEDRRAYLNYAFDAFVDLAYVMNCPLDFLSFNPQGSYNNQMLAIAFGARGSGKALAHYECGRVVINLTKMRGAGCLAHEWGHAFDDFLGVRCGVSGLRTFLSGAYRDNLAHTEITQAFDKVMEVMRHKDKPGEESLEESNKEIDRLVNTILKSWIDSSLKYFDQSPSGQRRSATPEEVEQMNGIVAKLYQTAEVEYYKQYLALYKAVKNVLPSKETRDSAEGILIRVKYIKETIKEYNDTGKFENRKYKETNFYKDAQKLDKYRKEPYYTESWEMFARCFESYIEDKLGFVSQYLVHSTKSNSLYDGAKPYPQDDERQIINNAIEELIKVAVDTFVTDGRKFNFNMYKNNEDWSNKYSTNKPVMTTPKHEERAKEIDKDPKGKTDINIESALVGVHSGFMTRLNGAQIAKVSETIQEILKNLGKHYYNGHTAVYKSINTGKAEDEEATLVSYDGLVMFNKPTDYEKLVKHIKESVNTQTGAGDTVVKIISPQLEGIMDMRDGDMERYAKALSKIVYAMNNVKTMLKNEGPEPKVVESKAVAINIDSIAETKDLREHLVNVAYETIKGKLGMSYENICLRLNVIAKKIGLGQIVLGDVPYKLAQGNSKGWRIQNGSLIVSNKETIEKKLESIIEPMVKVLVLRKHGNSSESDMISSGVAYMICKRLGLDVRTYCLDDRFDKMVKNKTQIKPYTNVCKDMYKSVMQELSFIDIIK